MRPGVSVATRRRPRGPRNHNPAEEARWSITAAGEAYLDRHHLAASPAERLERLGRELSKVAATVEKLALILEGEAVLAVETPWSSSGS